MALSKSSSKRRRSSTHKDRGIKKVQIATEKLDRASKILPLAGYFILGLTFIDYVFLLIPPHFLDPNWELNTIGHLVENVWAPLLGFLLVFLRRENTLRLLEIKVLSWLSRLILLMAIVYFLAAPLIVSNTIRIQDKSFSQLKIQLENQKTQVANIKQKLSQVPDEQLAKYLRQGQSSASKIDLSTPLLAQVLSKVDEEQTKSSDQIKTAYKQKILSLFKTSLKWILGSLLSGIMLLVFWKNTEWLRNISNTK